MVEPRVGPLWEEAFEALASEQGCSPDLLINEAMRAYAQQRPIAPHDVTVKSAPPPTPPRERNTPILPRAYLPRAPAASGARPPALPATARRAPGSRS